MPASTDRLQLRPLFEASATTSTVTELPGTPRGDLRVVEFSAFDCKGDRLTASLDPTSAAEWTTTVSNGVSSAEGRVALSATTGDVVYMRWIGRWDASRDGVVPPRIVCLFEGSGELSWLNKIVAAGVVRGEEAHRSYQLYELAVGPDTDADPNAGQHRLAPLFTLDNTIDTANVVLIPDTSSGTRAIGAVRLADLQGKTMRAHLHGSAAGDWAAVSSDRTVLIDVTQTLETDDGALIHLNYRGSTDASGGTYSTPSYVAGVFDTGHPRYEWLNAVLAIGEGRHDVPEVVSYHFYELR
jgi:hypothetical protein